MSSSIPRWIRLALLGAALVVFGYGATFYYVVRGAPFGAAQSFIHADPIIEKEVGRIQHIGLSWLWSISLVGASGDAEISCPISGSVANGTVNLELVRELGVWTVRRANLVMNDGRAVELDASGH